MNAVNKIIDLIKNDTKLGEDLFFLYDFKENIKRWTNKSHGNYKNMTWLFMTFHKKHNLVGFNNIDETIWTIDTNGIYSKACDTLQEFPYEMLRLECAYTKSETVAEYFKRYEHQQYQEKLEQYEQWCIKNKIDIDINNNYHDEHGNLFEKFFIKYHE